MAPQNAITCPASSIVRLKDGDHLAGFDIGSECILHAEGDAVAGETHPRIVTFRDDVEFLVGDDHIDPDRGKGIRETPEAGRR